MDGAFIVARDGTVEAACRLVDAPMTGLTLPKGLGTRHWAAAAITAVTRAVAVVVSQSNGTVRLFQDGDVILRIAPMRHARAMKWQETETEPALPQPRSERDKEKEKPIPPKASDSGPPVPSRSSLAMPLRKKGRDPGTVKAARKTSLRRKRTAPRPGSPDCSSNRCTGSSLGRLWSTDWRRSPGVRAWCWWPAGSAAWTSAARACATCWDAWACPMRSTSFPGGTGWAAGWPT